MTKIFQIIPKADAEMWRACGWTIESLPMPHGWYSVHAWRWG